jgi:hypothetical protein
MPGHYIHIAVSDKIVEFLQGLDDWPGVRREFLEAREPSLPDLPGPSPKALADIANMSPHYYSLGAIGPDLFFFLPDFRGAHGGVANFMISVVRWLEGCVSAVG